MPQCLDCEKYLGEHDHYFTFHNGTRGWKHVYCLDCIRKLVAAP